MKLPVYNSSKSITTETPNNVRDLDSYSQGAKLMTKAGSQMQALAQQWQESKDEVENLNARNQLQSQMTSILDEANNFNEYTTPAELQAKQNELSQRMNELTGNIMSGFSNNQKARVFESNANLAVQQNNIRLQGIFREKQIDMGRGNLVTSQQTNQEGFIATGNPTYKQTYLNDLETMLKAGIIDHEYAAKMKQKTDEWDVYHVLRQAETNPDAVINGLKNGKYNIKPEYYNDLLKDVTKIKTNAKIIQEYEQARAEEISESETFNYITSGVSFAEKMKYIDEKELEGAISEKYAAKLRRGIRNENPNKNSISTPQAVSEILQQAYDLNENITDNAEYLKGIKKIRENIMTLKEQGDLTTKDANALNKQIDSATRKKTAQASNQISYSADWKEARNYIENNLSPELRSVAYRELFYATENEDTSNMSKGFFGRNNEVAKFYKDSAVNVVNQIKLNNRENALKVKETKKENTQNNGWAF